MAQYRIKSDNTTLGKAGDAVTEDQLDGLNVEALLAGDHIELIKTSKTDKAEN